MCVFIVKYFYHSITHLQLCAENIGTNLSIHVHVLDIHQMQGNLGKSKTRQ